MFCLTASVYSSLSDGFDVVPRAIEPVVVEMVVLGWGVVCIHYKRIAKTTTTIRDVDFWWDKKRERIESRLTLNYV